PHDRLKLPAESGGSGGAGVGHRARHGCLARSSRRGYPGAMGRYLWVVVMVCACGEPILRNAPKPDPGAAAGVAAAAAAAATLADPNAAAKRQEQQTQSEPDNRGVVVKETVPAAVFDRLDEGSAAPAGAQGQAPAARSAQSSPASPSTS